MKKGKSLEILENFRRIIMWVIGQGLLRSLDQSDNNSSELWSLFPFVSNCTYIPGWCSDANTVDIKRKSKNHQEAWFRFVEYSWASLSLQVPEMPYRTSLGIVYQKNPVFHCGKWGSWNYSEFFLHVYHPSCAFKVCVLLLFRPVFMTCWSPLWMPLWM